LKGLAELPQRSEETRERLRENARDSRSWAPSWSLKKLDAETAAKIAPADEQKIIRAIEVCLLARKPLSEVHRTARKPLRGWKPIKLGLQLLEMHLEIASTRVLTPMLAAGWFEEVSQLLNKGYPENAKPFDFIGYRELRDVLPKQNVF